MFMFVLRQHQLKIAVHLINVMWIDYSVLTEANNIGLAIGMNNFWPGSGLKQKKSQVVLFYYLLAK